MLAMKLQAQQLQYYPNVELDFMTISFQIHTIIKIYKILMFIYYKCML